MPTAEQDSILNQLLDPITQFLTPEVARRIADLRAGEKLQSKVDDLADKANAGTLNELERSEYEQYVKFSQFVTLLQIQARNRLDETTESA
jgi:hypothetical protein